jgi:hypothetical protein
MASLGDATQCMKLKSLVNDTLTCFFGPRKSHSMSLCGNSMFAVCAVSTVELNARLFAVKVARIFEKGAVVLTMLIRRRLSTSRPKCSGCSDEKLNGVVFEVE